MGILGSAIPITDHQTYGPTPLERAQDRFGLEYLEAVNQVILLRQEVRALRITVAEVTDLLIQANISRAVLTDQIDNHEKLHSE